MPHKPYSRTLDSDTEESALSRRASWSIHDSAVVAGVSPANFKQRSRQRLPPQYALQALERFLGQRFRLVDLRFFLVRAANADANENIFL